jgi:tetratricopeptide (TPR) repeat protein/mono/diheme cytochrome c family protein
MASCLRAFVAALASVCVLATVAPASGQTGQVTFTHDIAPLVYTRCAACHHDGGPAPFALLTYAAVKQHATQIADVTRRRYMPPWKPDPDGSLEFVGSPRLRDDEIALIDRWVKSGAPEGDRAALPPPPEITPGWKLGKPDLVVSPSEAYTLPGEGTDVFRIFVIPIPTDALRYVRGLEFHPGNRVVHHANIRIDRTRGSRAFDDADPLPGYDGLIAHTAGYPDGHFLGWTPGQVPPLLPKGLAWRLEPGTDLVVELHMQPSGKPESVRPEIGFYFGADPPDRTPVMLRLGKQNIDIAPGDATYTVRDSFVLPVDVTLQAVQPHAHSRARQVRAIATLPDGKVTPILSIRDWDFRWQDVYRCVQPLALPKGTTLSMTITYDNSAANPRNPWIPPRQVYWGQRSADEMGDVWFQVLTGNARDFDLLTVLFRPKVLAEDVVGYERELTRQPDNAGLHDSAAMLYLELGNVPKVLEHFGASARLQPESGPAHFNLGTALSINNRLDEAVAELQRALELRPEYAQAHNNLGSILRQRGQLDEARAHFREAVRIDPANAEAHRNLGGLSRETGDGAAAVMHYEQALRARPDWPAAMTDLAWVLATSPDATLRDAGRAVKLAERTAELTGRREPLVLDVLAAAYASAGDFTRAVSTAESALQFAQQGPAADTIRSRLELYRRGTPFLAK